MVRTTAYSPTDPVKMAAARIDITWDEGEGGQKGVQAARAEETGLTQVVVAGRNDGSGEVPTLVVLYLVKFTIEIARTAAVCVCGAVTGA